MINKCFHFANLVETLFLFRALPHLFTTYSNNPDDMNNPQTQNSSPLLSALREQKAMQLKGGIYHRTQIDLTYNSNHIEGSQLSHEQTRYIFETNTIG